MVEYIPVLMFAVVCLMLMAGYPVAFSLAGTALIFAMVGTATGHFDMSFLHALPNRLYGTIDNTTLIAVPLFVLMGVMLENPDWQRTCWIAWPCCLGNSKGDWVFRW